MTPSTMAHTRIHWGRAIGMTALLAVVGGVVGSGLGTLVLLLMSIRHLADWSPDMIAGTWLIGTMVGTPLGIIGAPILGWLFLRRVPLGRAIRVTATGTVVGSLAGLATSWLARIGGEVSGLFLVGGAVVGFVVTSVVLWATTRDGAGQPAT